MNQVWNSLKTAIKLKLGLANPYRIHPRHRMLSNDRTIAQASFLQMKKINRNTTVARFQLVEQEKCLGIMIGQNVTINIGKVKHRFSPVSRIDQPGVVDIMISNKLSKEKKFAKELQTLKQGQKVSLQERKSPFIYHGYGKMEWNGAQPQTFKHIGIIAFDTSIRNVYNLIDSIMPNYDNYTGVSLLWIGQNHEEDFIFLEEFSLLAEQFKLNLNLMLKQNKPGWIGPFGYLNASHIKSFMPPPSDQSVLMLLGSTSDLQSLNKTVSQLGYKNVIQSTDLQ